MRIKNAHYSLYELTAGNEPGYVWNGKLNKYQHFGNEKEEYSKAELNKSINKCLKE